MNLYMHSYISPISHFTLDYFFISRTHLNTEIVQISHNFHMDFMLLDSKRFEEFLFLTQHKYKSNYSGCWICVFSCYFFVRFSCSFTLTIARVVKGKLRESWRGESDEENKRKSKTSAQIFDIFFFFLLSMNRTQLHFVFVLEIFSWKTDDITLGFGCTWVLHLE